MGYVARKKEIDYLVAMNQETAQEDVVNLPAGAAVVYDEPLGLKQLRDDLIFYAVPYDKLVAPVCPEVQSRFLPSVGPKAAGVPYFSSESLNDCSELQ